MIDRMDRISEAIKHELALILLEVINDPRIANITITKVEVTRDLDLANIYYKVYEDFKDESEAIARGLKKASGFMRGELSRRVDLRRTPKLNFREDKELVRSESIDEIFRRIEAEKKAGTAANGEEREQNDVT